MTFGTALRHGAPQCGADRRVIARRAVALATYLEHSDIAHTDWYLQATPELMTDIADAAETLAAGGLSGRSASAPSRAARWNSPASCPAA